MKNTKKRLAIIALVAIIGFAFSACGGGDSSGGGGIKTAALDAVIGEAWNAREGVKVASDASDVPTGRSWVTQNEFDDFDEALRAAAEVSANPSSQSDVDTAKTDLQAAIDVFKAAKKDGEGTAITLSGTITVTNNGRAVPYVKVLARTEDWQWQESVGIPSAEPDSPWEIIIKPFTEPTDIVFLIEGYSSDKYDNRLFATDVDGLKKTVYNEDVEDIAINLGDLKLITISGTFNLDYNGKKIPSVEIAASRKDDSLRLGFATILNAGNNTPWSIAIPAQDVDTDITFQIVGFDGPIPWGYDQLFAIWNGQDYGVKVKNQNKPGIALKFITISGTVNIPSVPVVDIQISKRVSDDDYPWIAGINLYNPPANAPWGPLVIPAFTSNTEIHVGVNGYDDEDVHLFWVGEVVKTTAKDRNITGIAVNLNFITISGTISVTYNGEPVPTVHIYSYKTSDGQGLGNTSLNSPSANSPWCMWIPAFTSNTEINIDVVGFDDDDWLFGWDDGPKTITVKNTNVTDIELDLGDITD